MSAEISYRGTTKFIQVLPGTLQILYQEVRELFGNILPGQWFIGSINTSNGEKKYLDPDEYRSILLASPGGEKIEFYIEKISDETDESIKDANFTISIYDSRDVFVGGNKDKNIDKILEDLSSDEEQKEESKENRPTDKEEKGVPTAREDPGDRVNRRNLHQRESPRVSEMEALEQQLDEGLKAKELETLEELAEELEKKRREHKELSDKGKQKRAAELEPAIQELEHLQELSAKIESLKRASVASEPVKEKLEDLEKEFNNGLEKNEFENLEELIEVLEKKKKEHKELSDKGKQKRAAELEPSIKELGHLQELFAKIEKIKQSIAEEAEAQSKGRLVELERELNEGLEGFELESLEELLEELEKKRKEHKELSDKGKEKRAAELEPSIKRLERLQELFTQIESLQQPTTVGSKAQIFELEKELNEGFQKYELENSEELLEELEKKRKERKELLDKGKEKRAAELEPALQELERLQTLFAQIKALKQPSKVIVQPPVVDDEKIIEEEEVIPVDGPENVDQKQVGEDDSQEVVSEEKMSLRLKSLYENFNLMPNCVERSLQALIYYSLLKIIKNQESFSKIQIPENLDEEMAREFENFKERAKAEDNFIPNLDRKLKTWKAKLDHDDFESLKEECTVTMNELRPLNIQELLKLLKEGERTVDLIQNEEVILLLGGTGSGKSTTIHFLAGSIMARDGDHIYPKKVKNAAAETVRTSSASVSETRYIHAVPVDLQELDPLYDGKVLITDTPGFGDTAGAEVDIANAISIYRAVCKCKSVKPILLISSKGIGDRMQGLKELAHILVGMIPGIKDHIGAVSYFFTKYEKAQEKGILPSLMKLNSELTDQEKSDEGFKILFKDLVRKTRDDLVVIDPMNGNPAKVLNKVLLAPNIPKPKDLFKFSINEESKGTLQNQAHKHQLSINAAAKRLDFELVEYKLEELKQLCEALKLESLDKVYASCISELGKFLHQQYCTATAQIEKCLVEGNVLTDAEVKHYQLCIQNAQLADRLRDLYLDQEVVSSQAYVNYLNERIDSMMFRLEERSLDDLSLKAILDKAKLLASSFEDVEPTYKEACVKFLLTFKNTVEEFKRLYAQHSYEESGVVLTKIHKSIGLYGNHVEKEDTLKREYESLKVEMKETLINLVRKIEPIFKQEQLKEKDIEALKVCIERLEDVKNSISLQSHLSKGDVNSIYMDLANLAVKYFEGIAKRIDKVLDEKKDSLAKVEGLIGEMAMIKSVSSLESKCLELFFTTFSKITDYILKLKTDIINELNKVSQENQKISYSKIYNQLVELQDAKWISKYRDNIYTNLMHTVKEEILEQFKILRDDLRETQISWDNAENVKAAYQKISIMDEMKSFENIFSELKSEREEIQQEFDKKMNYVFDKIEKNLIAKCKKLSDLSFEVEKVKKAIDFLEVSKKIPKVDQKASDLLDKLQDSIRKCDFTLGKDFEDAFAEIEKYMENIVNGTFQLNEEIMNSSGKILESDSSDNSSPEGSFNFESAEDKNKNIKRRIDKRIKEISSNLQDLQNIRDYKVIYDLFDGGMLKKYEKKIQDIVNEVPENMQTLIVGERHVDLNTYIQVAKALTEFDQFLSPGNEDKFMNIAKKFYGELLDNTKGKMSDIMKKISLYEFEDDVIRQYMDEMNVPENILFRSQFQKLKTLLNYTIRNLIEETSKRAWLVRWRDQETARKEADYVTKNLVYLKKAGENLGVYLDDGTNKIESCQKEVAARFSKGLLEYLDNISEQIANYNFSKQVREKIEFADQINNVIGKFLNEDVEKKIRELNGIESKSLKTLEGRFSKMTIQEYVTFPPKQILEKLQGRDTYQYTDVIKAIEEKVRGTVEEELEKATKSNSYEQSKRHLRDVGSALHHLPENMKTHFEHRLKEYQENLEKKWSDFKEKLTNLARNPSADAYEKLTKQCQEIGDKITLNEIENLIDRDLAQIRKNISHKLSDKQIKETRGEILNVLEYVVKLSPSFERIKKQHWTGVEAAILTGTKKAYESFFVKFRNPEASLDPQALQKSLREFLAYGSLQSKLKDDMPDQGLSLETMFEDFSVRFEEVRNMMQASFAEVEKMFDEGLTKLNMKELAHCLMLIREWEPLIKPWREADHNFEKAFVGSTKNIDYQKMNSRVQEDLKQLINKDRDLKFINDHTKDFAGTRQQYYDDLERKLKILYDAKEYLSIFDPNLTTFYSEVLKIVENQKKSLSDAATDALSKIFVGKMEGVRDKCKEFELYFSNLAAAEKTLSLWKNRYDSDFAKLEHSFNEKFSNYVCTIEADVSRMDSYIYGLKFIKTLSSYIQPFKEKIDTKINEILDMYKTKRGGAQGIAKLGTLLNTDTTGIGQRIIDEHSVFKGYSLSLFNTKTQKHGIDYVLEKLEGDKVEKDKLKDRYEDFDNHYKDLIQKNLKRNPDLAPIIANVKLLAGNVLQKPDQITWNRTININLPEMMAHVFALWTLKNAQHYFEVEDMNDRQNFLLQPHAAQVISIFRLLGVGATDEKLQNNLVQIGTGEGKSITLAVTAAIFASLGFEVSCACYSQYLCDRDYEAFKSLFDALGLTQNIHYGTFNKLCESALNQNGEVRKIVESLITNGIRDAMLMNKEFGRARILLIDEVDVFFSKNFYGELYTPSVNLRDPTVPQLLDYIWENRDKKLKLATVKTSPQYQACFARFKDYGFLVEEAVKDMLFDLKEYSSHQYIVKENKIGYVDGDSVSFQAVNRYQTVFAYYAEHEKKNISKKSLDENKWMRIVCGNFSYAEIPKQFSFIMGVTGTLKTLAKPERKVIEETYAIRKNTYSPSVFGANNFKFEKKDVYIEKAIDYYNRIETEVKKKMTGSKGKERAILVFFESGAELDACRKSPAFNSRREKILCLTEEANAQEKDNIIKRATCSGQITFLTRTFGRGTDFVVNDQDVIASGGIHVIQTFVSDELSEEVQIQGRTARQGDEGTFSMVLLDKSLEKFLITNEDLKKVEDGQKILSKFCNLFKDEKVYPTKYDFINERRNDSFEGLYQERQKFVTEAKEQHDKAVGFMNNIKDQNVSKVKEFLLDKNKGTAELVPSKTVVAMDATGSMTHLLVKAKTTVQTMFERVCGILKDHKIAEDSFGMQFSVYRNYSNNKNLLLQSSIWATKPDDLRSFMEKIGPDGGLGNEAVEIGLWHANSEHVKEGISQVILIGDMPANTEAEVSDNRSIRGETYWAKTQFAEKTFWRQEAEKLKASGVPVHAFYVDEDAKANFTEIATLTNGRCEFLDVNSTKGADLLTNMVSEVLLNNIGQQNGGKGADLVNAYKKKFLKSYS